MAHGSSTIDASINEMYGSAGSVSSNDLCRTLRWTVCIVLLRLWLVVLDAPSGLAVHMPTRLPRQRPLLQNQDLHDTSAACCPEMVELRIIPCPIPTYQCQKHTTTSYMYIHMCIYIYIYTYYVYKVCVQAYMCICAYMRIDKQITVHIYTYNYYHIIIFMIK